MFKPKIKLCCKRYLTQMSSINPTGEKKKLFFIALFCMLTHTFFKGPLPAKLKEDSILVDPIY